MIKIYSLAMLAMLAMLAVLAFGAAFEATAAQPPRTTVPVDPLASYYGNLLVCQNQETKAICRAWINADGRYYVFYDMGQQPKVPDTTGPFRVQGRWGSWTLRGEPGEYELCLWIGAPRVQLGAERQREMYSESECYPFTPHKVGDTWMEKDLTGRPVKFWLMAGR